MNQISPENTVSIEELQGAFSQSYGVLIGQLTIKNLSLEKQLKAQAKFIQEMTTNEAALVQNLQELEDELIELKSSSHTLNLSLEKQLKAQAKFIQEMTTNEAALVQNLQELEDKLIELKSSPHLLSPAQREIARKDQLS